ncbi:MAG: HIT family protein [Deltaproteobacteria bacterium]|nr:HIT family protein [Deltaproteobacteria bacterium]
MFALDPRLAAETTPITQLPLCLALLRDETAYPWLLLVPNRDSIRELHQLLPLERGMLVEEAALACRVMERVFAPHKINLGALGNLVPQFHLHVVGRKPDDAAWPGPVWGHAPPSPYPPAQKEALAEKLKQAFEEPGG